ncbi:MAG: DUF177 domain-containing protein [Gemmatimonadetes bacterium]|nr:DUF177 domain-containing protein [Gemmatimonadota bacterium]
MEALRIPVAALRNGAVRRRVDVVEPSALGETPTGLDRVSVELEAEGTPREGVRITCRATAEIRAECRRCLEPQTRRLEIVFDVWYRPATEATRDEERVWPLARDAAEVDVSAALREELWVATPEYVECEPACEGLCPRCGARRPEEPCTCPPPEPDPRWAALRRIDVDGTA